jgi:hypothetical protein
MRQASLHLLQSRSWASVTYLPACGHSPAALSRALAARLHAALPAAAPPAYTVARLGHCLAYGRRGGLVLDGVVQAASLPHVVQWAHQLRAHAPAVQVLIGVRLDTGAPMPIDVRHIRLPPLQDADADYLLERCAAEHARRRFGLPLAPAPPPPPAAVMPAPPEDSAREPRRSHGSRASLDMARPAKPPRRNGILRRSVGTPRAPRNGAVKPPPPPPPATPPAPPPQLTEPDIAQIVAPVLALAREGAALCRGVPLLLHVLLQVALACVLTPQAHDAAAAFSGNLQARLP